MPKSEHAEVQYDVTPEESNKVIYDVEATLDEDLSLIPDAIELNGRWLLQFRGGEIYTKPGWQAANFFFQPIRPVGEQVVDQEDLKELKSLRHRRFYVSRQDKREVRAMFAAMDVDAGKLRVMIEDGKGEYLTAHVRLGKDWRGDPEYKLSSFKPHTGDDDIPFDVAAE